MTAILPYGHRLGRAFFAFIALCLWVSSPYARAQDIRKSLSEFEPAVEQELRDYGIGQFVGTAQVKLSNGQVATRKLTLTLIDKPGYLKPDPFSISSDSKAKITVSGGLAYHTLTVEETVGGVKKTYLLSIISTSFEVPPSTFMFITSDSPGGSGLEHSDKFFSYKLECANRTVRIYGLNGEEPVLLYTLKGEAAPSGEIPKDSIPENTEPLPPAKSWGGLPIGK